MVLDTDPTKIILRAQRHENQLREDDRLMSLLENYHVIILPDGQFAAKLTWCLETCQSKFRDLGHPDGRAWYFHNEQDAIMFSMKWS